MKRIVVICIVLSTFMFFSLSSMAVDRKINSKGNLQYNKEISLLEEDFNYLRNEIKRLDEERK